MTRCEGHWRCCLRKHDEESHHLEVVDSLKLALHGMSAAWREQAGDGAFLFLADDGGHGLGEQFLCGAHVLAVLGHFVEAGAGTGVGQVAPDAKPLQAVESLLGLSEWQQNRPVVARHARRSAERADNRARWPCSAASPTARRQKITPGGIADSPMLCCGRDGKCAKWQPLQPLSVFLEETREVDAEIVQGEVSDRDAAARGLRGR